MVIRLFRTLGLLLLAANSAVAYADCNSSLPATTPDSRFVPMEEGTVLDTATGLIWMRCPHGSNWDNDGCVDDASTPNLLSWADALQASAATVSAGNDSWRLPNKIELDSIVERKCSGPALNERIFPPAHLDQDSLPPGAMPNYYWTNSPNQFNINAAWAIEFLDGAHVSIRKQNEFSVRLVRDHTPAQ